MSEWMDIATAPKVDGQEILVWLSYTAVEAERADVPGRMEVARWSDWLEAWMLDQDCVNEKHPITLWQPISAPLTKPLPPRRMG